MTTAAFFNIPAHGHVNPTLPVVQELIRRGETVYYYAAETFRPQIEATGAIFRACGPAEPLSPAASLAGPFQAMARILAIGEGLLPGLLDQLRADRPDYVVYDSMCPWGKQAAQALGLPAIASCSLYVGYSKNMKAHKVDPSLLLGIGLALPKLLVAARQYGKTARRIQKRFGLPSPPPLDFFINPGDITLAYTSREFQAGAELLDDTFKFVGPSLAPRADAGDFPLDWLAGSQVIYISLGTLFNDRPEFFRACLDAFADSPYQVVMAVGGQAALERLGSLPDNVLVRPKVPQLEVLQRAALFITHGGMNSVNEAFYYGVPLLVAPQVGDQLFIARRVAALGAGLQLGPKDMRPEVLRALAERVINEPGFWTKSEALGRSLRAAGGAVRAADEVLGFVARRRALQPEAAP